ncbi:cysteine hydrolase family protein [Nocardioides aquaticus]|uniref:cysteine hydrolase family protein n=1 Tax=Nocardioides aquaticus TaxID=160826 RepID=UPI001BD3B85E|nr:isochorismatase family cysteine hydrolase [Nocardioides aquaticus]
MSAEAPVVGCLIVVDMQRAFVEGAGASPHVLQLLPAVRQQLSAARRANALVVQLQNDGALGAPDEPGSWGWQLSLEPASTDVVIRKSEDSGFVGTNLHLLLQERSVTAVSVCGVMSEMCVAATARDAMRWGYEVVLAHDSHGTYPVPPYSSGESEVRAEDAARAAEWSLGDGITIPAHGTDVRFLAPAPGENCARML